MTAHRFLLISRIGTNSLHRHWLAPAAERRFDVLLSAYAADVKAPSDAQGVHFEHRPGRKVAGYGEILAAHRDLIARYDHVALFDDDLLIDAVGISRLFEIASAHRLKIAQPALTPDSHFTYGALLRHPGFLLRHVNYVEMMCPIFRADALAAIAPLYGMGYESGIDLIWCNLVHESPADCAVIDAVPVRHTQPVGTAKAANGFVAGRTYEDDIGAILARFGAEWLPCAPYGGILADGRAVTGRAAMWPAALSLATAIPRAGKLNYKGLRYRTRGLAVYWNHLLRAQARNPRLTWPADLEL